MRPPTQDDFIAASASSASGEGGGGGDTPSFDTTPGSRHDWDIEALLQFMEKQPFALTPGVVQLNEVDFVLFVVHLDEYLPLVSHSICLLLKPRHIIPVQSSVFVSISGGQNAPEVKKSPVIHAERLPKRTATYGEHSPPLTQAADAVFSRGVKRHHSRSSQSTNSNSDSHSSASNDSGKGVGAQTRQFYAHQVAGCGAVRRGCHAVVATSTGSGTLLDGFLLFYRCCV